jgi:hypothetical protein
LGSEGLPNFTKAFSSYYQLPAFSSALADVPRAVWCVAPPSCGGGQRWRNISTPHAQSLDVFRIAIAQNADPINQIYGILFSP